MLIFKGLKTEHTGGISCCKHQHGACLKGVRAGEPSGLGEGWVRWEIFQGENQEMIDSSVFFWGGGGVLLQDPALSKIYQRKKKQSQKLDTVDFLFGLIWFFVKKKNLIFSQDTEADGESRTVIWCVGCEENLGTHNIKCDPAAWSGMWNIMNRPYPKGRSREYYKSWSKRQRRSNQDLWFLYLGLVFFWVGGSAEEKDGKGGGGHDLYLLVRGMGMRMRIRYRNR